MAENDPTTIQDKETLRKVEALIAIEKVKEILTNLASIAVLRIHAASGSDLSPGVWRELYKGTPWVVFGEIPKEILPLCMEEELNKMIVKQLGFAWTELNEINVFEPKIYDLLAKRRREECGVEPEAA